MNAKQQSADKPGDVVGATDAVSVAQGVVDDHADVQNAQAQSRENPSSGSKSLLRVGPGVITGVADDDPSGIGTYSVAGAQFGYQLLWLAPVCVPLMIAVQEMCGRVALVTSKGLSAIIKEHYSKWLLYGVLVLLVGANTINVYADINIMAASMKMLFGLPFALWATVLTIGMVVAQVTIPYKHYVKFLKYACLSLFAYVIIAVLPKVHVDWYSVVHHMVIPHLSLKPEYVLTVVGFLGYNHHALLLLLAGRRTGRGRHSRWPHRRCRQPRKPNQTLGNTSGSRRHCGRDDLLADHHRFHRGLHGGNVARFRQDGYQHSAGRSPCALAARRVGLLAVHSRHPGCWAAGRADPGRIGRLCGCGNQGMAVRALPAIRSRKGLLRHDCLGYRRGLPA